MKRKIAGSIVLLLMIGAMLGSCSSGKYYYYNGKKSKNCGCPTHRGIVG